MRTSSRSAVVLLVGVVITATGPPAQAQTNYAWNTGNGTWGAAGSWTPGGGPPGVLDSATINIAGSYTATLNDNRSINNVTLNNSTATISHTGGTLIVGGNVALTSGVYSLVAGTISGGSITSGGGTLRPGFSNANRLNNMAIGLGVLDLSTTDMRLRLQGTTILAAGTVLTLGAGAQVSPILSFEQTTTLNNLTINLTGPDLVSVDGDNTLTLAPSTTITMSSPTQNSRIVSNVFAGSTGAIQNQGLIRNTSSGSLFIIPSSFTNTGTLQATGGTLQVNPATFTNYAAGTLAGGTYLAQGGAIDFVSRNVSTIAAGTTVEIGGVAGTFNALNTLTTNSGTFRITGGKSFDPSGSATILNTGATAVVEVGAASTLTSNLTVNGGGTLRGHGTLAGNVTFDTTGGTLSPGVVGPGKLTVTGNSVLNGNTSVTVELNGSTAGTGYDQLSVDGNITLGNAILSLTLGYSPAVGDKLFILDKTSAGPIPDTFSNLPEGSTLTINGFPATISYLGDFDTMTLGTGNDVVLVFTPVPEPVAAGLVAAAGLVVGWFSRRLTGRLEIGRSCCPARRLPCRHENGTAAVPE